MATALYETDFYTWTQRQAQHLRLEEFEKIDWQNIAEEIESLGKRERNEIRSRLRVLLMHLLKWQWQPRPDSERRSWRSTIDEQRYQLHILLEDNPTLRTQLPDFVAYAYPYAVKGAANETGLAPTLFPRECTYTVAQLLDEEFWP